MSLANVASRESASGAASVASGAVSMVDGAGLDWDLPAGLHAAPLAIAKHVMTMKWFK